MRSLKNLRRKRFQGGEREGRGRGEGGTGKGRDRGRAGGGRVASE